MSFVTADWSARAAERLAELRRQLRAVEDRLARRTLTGEPPVESDKEAYRSLRVDVAIEERATKLAEQLELEDV